MKLLHTFTIRGRCVNSTTSYPNDFKFLVPAADIPTAITNKLVYCRLDVAFIGVLRNNESGLTPAYLIELELDDAMLQEAYLADTYVITDAIQFPSTTTPLKRISLPLEEAEGDEADDGKQTTGFDFNLWTCTSPQPLGYYVLSGTQDLSFIFHQLVPNGSYANTISNVWFTIQFFEVRDAH